MKILILTQEERLYLPPAIAQVCRDLDGEVCCLVAAPAMSTHGGAVKGLIRHVRLFGPTGTAQMVARVAGARLKDMAGKPGPDGRPYSMKAVAAMFGLPYHAIKKVNSDEFHALIDRYQPDLLVSMSCPQIIGKKVRGRFPAGCINVHGAPLPKYRGLMPAFWALRNNEPTTAATVHDLADKLDNGEILAQTEVPIAPEDTWESLVRKTKAAGARGLVEVCKQIKEGTARRTPNRDEDATYFSFPTDADRRAFLAAGRRFF